MKTNLCTILALFISTSLFSQNLEDGLIAKFTLNKTSYQNNLFIDLTSNSNNIKGYDLSFFDDDNTGGSEGAIAIGFPIAESFMVLNEEENLPTINNLENFSISFWNLRGSVGSQQGFNPIINIEDDNGVAFNLEIDQANDIIRLTNIVNGDINAETHSYTIFTTQLNDWHHIAMTVDYASNKMQIYFDGELEGEITTASLQLPENPVISFAKYRNGNYTEIVTCFDNLFIHNRVLTSGEVILAMQETITSVENNIFSPDEVSVFPNPSKSGEVLNIDFTGMTSKTIVDISDVQGRLIRTEKLNNNQINIAQLSRGIYFLKIKTEEGSFVKKILIE